MQLFAHLRPFSAYAQSDGFVYLSLEAESGSMAAPMSVISDPAAYGSSAIMYPTGQTGEASFQVTLANAGDYVIRARTSADNAASDSFFVSVNGEGEDIFDAAEDRLYSKYAWRVVNGRGGQGVPLTLNPAYSL